MNKLTNLKYPLKYTSTDFIAYTGELPDCLPSSTSTCNPMDRSLTKLFQLLLERYCEPSANPLDADISELDIECLLEANPDIEIGDDLTLKDLLIYYKEHLCEIYDRLCAECEPDLTCVIDLSGEQEASGSFCEFIQNHEDRITELENAPSADPYVPEPLVIPINKFLNLQSQSEILLNIAPYIKYKTPEYYFSKTPDGAKLDSLVNNFQSELGNYGRLWLDSDAQYLRYAHLISPPDTGDDYFEYYLTDGSGNNYLMPISIYSVNACCSGEPSVPSGEAVLQTYILEFDVNGWNTEGQFLDANVTITSDPSVGGETATPGALFVLTFNHGLSLVGTYSAVAIYMDSVTGAISTANLTSNTIDIQLANNPFNILGENIKIKVIITQ